MSEGGSYIKDAKTGERKLVERTGHHKDGDRPRDAKGKPINRLVEETSADSKTASKTPATKVKE